MSLVITGATGQLGRLVVDSLLAKGVAADQIVALGPKYRQKVRDEPALMALLERARDSHDAAVTRGEAAPTGAPKILDRADGPAKA